MKAYRIVNWDARFEVPSDPDSLDDRLIKSSKLLSKGKTGAAALAVWLLLVKFASKMPQRGLLVSAKKALTVECLAEETGFSRKLIQMGIDLLMSPEMSWIERVDCPKYLVLGDHAACGHIASAPQMVSVAEVNDSEAPLVAMNDCPPMLERPSSSKKKAKSVRSIEWKKTQSKFKDLRSSSVKNRWSASMLGSFYLPEDDLLDEDQEPGKN